MKHPPTVNRTGDPTSSHPESMTAELPARDEESLAGLADELWPADEYQAIVRLHARQIRGPG